MPRGQTMNVNVTHALAHLHHLLEGAEFIASCAYCRLSLCESQLASLGDNQLRISIRRYNTLQANANAKAITKAKAKTKAKGAGS